MNVKHLVTAATVATLAAAVAAPPARAGKDDFGTAAVVFARDHALWQTDPRGKGPAIELAALPGDGAAADVRMIRSDADGHVVIFDLGGAWYWFRTGGALPATAEPLPCASDARVTLDGKSVVCGDADGHVVIRSLVTGRKARRAVPAAGARVVAGDGGRDLVWADADGIWAAPLNHPTARRNLAPEPPLRGFSASPDGGRAMGVYATTAWVKRKQIDAEMLMTFALDGKAARRKSIQDGVVVDWSWSGEWLLIQEGTQACIARVQGGEYKCWKGYYPVSLAPDGRWALVLGPRKGGDGKDADDGKDKARDGDQDADGGEAGDGDDDADADAAEAVPGLPAGPLSLYRAKLEGAYTEKPSLVESEIDGAAALWLPDAAATTATE